MAYSVGKIKALQSALKDLGVYTGKIDGDPGPLTIEALNKIEAGLIQKPVDPAPVPPVATPLPMPPIEPGVDTTPAEIEKGLDFTLPNEGGYTNHPKDKGGPTNRGITLGTLSSWLGRTATATEVKNLSMETTKAIYKKNYWDKLNLDYIMEQNNATALFDMGVLCGPGRSAQWAQEICGVAVDHAIGPVTIAALNRISNEVFIPKFADRAQAYFIDIVKRKPDQGVFLKGWTNRTNRLRALAIDSAINANIPKTPVIPTTPVVEVPVVTTPTAPVGTGPAPQYWKPGQFHPMFQVPAGYTHLHPKDVLYSVKGQAEILGNKDNPLIAHFHEHSGNLGTHSESADYHDEVPHCASALNWAADGAGCEKSDNALASSFENYASRFGSKKYKIGDTVPEGAIVCINGHVTLANRSFKYTGGGTFEGFGSNQGNTIKTSTFSQSSIRAISDWKPKPGTILAPISSQPIASTGSPGESTR